MSLHRRPTVFRIVVVALLASVSLALVETAIEEAIGSVRDVEGVLWTEYFDEGTGRPYYHNAMSGRTQWVVSLPPEADGRSSLHKEVSEERSDEQPVAIDPQTKPDSPTVLEPPPETRPAALPTSSSDTGDTAPNAPAGVAGVAGSGKRTKRKSKKSSSKGNKNAAEKRPRRAAASHSDPPALSPATVAQKGAPWLEAWPVGHEYGSIPEDAYYGPGYYTLGMPLDYGDYYAVGGPGGLYDGGLAYMDAASFEAMNGGVAQPPDQDVLHLLQDPAGMVQLESLVTAFDRLEGVANRGEFAYPLKSPLVFHEMFLRSPGVSSGVEDVRASLEERLSEDDHDFEAWEQLGHVWRHYGNVPRTVDCYRKALSVLPPDAHAIRSSLHINLAGLLDQMNFVSDALVVLHTFLDAHDVTTYEAENNFAVGYMMVSQLELRAKRLDAAEHSLAASLQLQPRLRPAVMGVQKELRHWRKVGGSSSTGGGGVSGGSSPASPSPSSSSSDSPRTTVKDPWVMARLAALCLQLVDWVEASTLRLASRLTGGKHFTMQPMGLGHRVVNASRLLAARAPRALVLSRKLGNALPCVVSGLTSRAIAELGWRSSLVVAPYHASKRPINRRRGWAVSLTFPLLLGHTFSLLTDFMIVDCLVLLFVGGLFFPLVAHSTETRLGPLYVRVIKA